MGAHKLYTLEASNHLGNVLTLFTDKKIPVGTAGTVSYYKADLVSSMDYSPFGAPLKGRTFNGSGSRYGFNGKEKDNEIEGSGNTYDFGARMYDARLGRWLSLDPSADSYAGWSTYCFSLNTPIQAFDPNGKWVVWVHYIITFHAAIKLGYSKEIADKIAHLSATYSDHPSDNVLKVNGHSNELYWRKGIDYSKTNGSQNNDAHAKWHSMMSDTEAKNGMTETQACQRGLSFGWGKIFLQGLNKAELDMGEFGQGLHALQDYYAHHGAKMHDHLGINYNSMWYILNDIGKKNNDDNRGTESITQSAFIVLDIMKGVSKNLKDGLQLNLEGTSTLMRDVLKSHLDNLGYTIDNGAMVGKEGEKSFQYTMKKKNIKQ